MPENVKALLLVVRLIVEIQLNPAFPRAAILYILADILEALRPQQTD